MEITVFNWFHQSLAALPLALWIFLGIGIPWSLLILPRRDWHDRALILCVAIALGPAILTAWMFVPGTIGGMLGRAFLRFDLIFGGTLLIVLIGLALVLRKARRTTAVKYVRQALAPDEKVLIALLTLAVMVRWVVVAYWPFTTYDSLWVYGFQGRLWTLQGFISPDIGYYPQFLQLQYAFMQLGVGGIDDHAARMVIPFLHIGSILATYVLGARLFKRRAGIIAASIWALYPHVGNWAHIGDLEIPQAFLFTLSASFFLMAWTTHTRFLRRRYGLLAGMLFGIAMWTKPTAGAFIWGVILLVIVALIRARFRWRLWYPRFEVAAITGLACLPLGTLWYVRNIVLGHPPLVFPHPSWLNLATRSGDLLSWPILALLVLAGYLATTGKLKRGSWLLLAGLILVLLSIAPTSPLLIRFDMTLSTGILNPIRLNPPFSRLNLQEWIGLFFGLLFIAMHLRSYISAAVRPVLAKLGWAYLLALPYYVTWFHSYSYHARLSFAIVPLLLLPTAVLLAHWISTSRVRQWPMPLRSIYLMSLIVVGLSAISVSILSIDRHDDWLWNNRYTNDLEKYMTQNPGVVLTAQQLWGYEGFHKQAVKVVAPGEQRLPFFFPQDEIITDTIPTTYAELGDATHFVYGSQAQWRYENDHGIDPLDNQIVASLGRQDIMTQVLHFTDGRFRYEVYDLHLEERFTEPEDSAVGNLTGDEVIFGNFVRFRGVDLSNTQLAGNTIFMEILWEVQRQADKDYWVSLSLINEQDGQIYHVWEEPVSPNPHAYYNSQLWEPGEFIVDERKLILENPRDLPRGPHYRIFVNLVDRETGQHVPVTINGEHAENGYPLASTFAVGR